MSGRFLRAPRGHVIVAGRVHRVPTEADETKPTFQRPTKFRTIAVSLYERDMEIIDGEIRKQVEAGESPNRSLVIRRALRRLP